jgi:hypothetical protein
MDKIGRMRHPVYLGLRADMRAEEITRGAKTRTTEVTLAYMNAKLAVMPPSQSPLRSICGHSEIRCYGPERLTCPKETGLPWQGRIAVKLSPRSLGNDRWLKEREKTATNQLGCCSRGDEVLGKQDVPEPAIHRSSITSPEPIARLPHLLQ